MSLLTGVNAAYSFDDGAGTAALDATGGDNTGTLNGTTLPTWVPGGGLTFSNANGNYVDCGAGAALYSPALTYSFWVTFNAVATPYRCPIGRNNSGSDRYAVILLNNSRFTYAIADNAGLAKSFMGSTLSAGVLYHVVMTYDGAGTLSGYINSLSDGVITGTGAIGLGTTGQSLFIGSEPYVTGRTIDGTIYRADIFDRAIDRTEVAQLYNSGLRLPYPFGVRRMGRPLGSRIIIP